MAFLGSVSPLGGGVGLQVLLAVGTSSVLVRGANIAVGIALPVYQSIRALEDRVQPLQRKWLGYWSVYGCITSAESALGPVVTWLPLYHHFKLGFLIWLQLPPDYGFVRLYCRVLRPLFHQYRREIDPVLQRFFEGLSAFKTAHQSEMRAVSYFVQEAVGRAVGVVHSCVDTVRRHGRVNPTNPSIPPSPFLEDNAISTTTASAGAAPNQASSTSVADQGAQNVAGQGWTGGQEAAGEGPSSSSDVAGWVHVASNQAGGH